MVAPQSCNVVTLIGNVISAHPAGWSMRSLGTDDVEYAAMNQDSYHDITGVILVGEKSYRIEHDKAFLHIAGKTFFE
jgi:hypothetical protein